MLAFGRHVADDDTPALSCLVSKKGTSRAIRLFARTKMGAAEHKLENAYAGVRPIV